MAQQHWLKSRQIVRRIVIEGMLELLSPAGFGNGDNGITNGITDMTLLYDPLQGCALLTGASIAGALRNYLWENEQGYAQKAERKNDQHKKSLTVQLFGSLHGDPEGAQSPLIVDDALGASPTTELRDGVSIDPRTRTAEASKKFDYELLRAGTTFPLRFELLLSQSDNPETSDQLRNALTIALHGLERPGEIHLGVRKRRGLGECQVKGWRVTEYDLTDPQGLLAWLNNRGEAKACRTIAEGLPTQPEQFAAWAKQLDQRCWFRLSTTLALESSLLIRSGIGPQGEQPAGADTTAYQLPDSVHLHRLQANSDQRTPVLPGTSIAGALRQRALRIAQTLHSEQGADLVNQLFGIGPARKGDQTHTGSRVRVAETPITASVDNLLVQNRIRIDRFTGGVLDNLLFDEAPLFGNEDVQVRIDVAIHQPTPAEIGLFLLLLKDLWLADLPVGGGANIGRGRLSGRHANLIYQAPKATATAGNPSTAGQTLPSFHLALETVAQINDQPMLRLTDIENPQTAQPRLVALLEDCVQALVQLEVSHGTAN